MVAGRQTVVKCVKEGDLCPLKSLVCQHRTESVRLLIDRGPPEEMVSEAFDDADALFMEPKCVFHSSECHFGGGSLSHEECKVLVAKPSNDTRLLQEGEVYPGGFYLRKAVPEEYGKPP